MHYNRQYQGGVNSHTTDGAVNLYELNVNRHLHGSNLIYPFIKKESTLTSFKTISNSSFYSNFTYGDTLSSSYPLLASITREFWDGTDENRNHVRALQNTLNYYTYLSSHYAYSSSMGQKQRQELALVDIPSIFYGSSIKKGSVVLRYFITGNLVSELRDKNKNGELIEVTGAWDRPLGRTAGVVLYNEGFLVLTGAWHLSPHQQKYDSVSDEYAKWTKFMASGTVSSGNTPLVSSSYQINFEGVNYIPTITMMAHAKKGKLNYSTNPTFLLSSSSPSISSSTTYAENAKRGIFNTVSGSYYDPGTARLKTAMPSSHTSSFKKQTFISRIGIYDEKKNLIAVAKVATPVKKTEERDFTFKLKLDI